MQITCGLDQSGLGVLRISCKPEANTKFRGSTNIVCYTNQEYPPLLLCAEKVEP